jgi:dihydroxyacetone synthase
MRYAPHNPEFFDRDRFVLSNGHACLFQYAFLHLTGYKSMTFEQLKSYHSPKVDTLCPGHPEIEIEGIEVTTGPLGQGVGNAVGMAMATKHLAATYNRPGFDVISNHIWCMVGDACLQEGVALEAMSLAGHLKLNNLTIIYDNNQVTCDGSVDLTNTEDVNAKMIATGWEVINVEDGCFDIEGLVTALNKAKTSLEKPVFVNVRTVIGLGSAVAGTSLAHGDAFGADDIANMKRASGFDPNEHFVIPNDVHEFFADTVPRGYQLVGDWCELFGRYSSCYPEPAAQLASRLRGDLPANWESHIPANFPQKSTATRVSSGLVFNPIAEKVNSFVVGSADLSDDVEMLWTGAQDFQNPSLKPQCGIMGSYAGRYVRYGIREHAMVAIANGLAAYHPNMIIPVTSS